VITVASEFPLENNCCDLPNPTLFSFLLRYSRRKRYARSEQGLEPRQER
jgi:hypothetical protein